MILALFQPLQFLKISFVAGGDRQYQNFKSPIARYSVYCLLNSSELGLMQISSNNLAALNVRPAHKSHEEAISYSLCRLFMFLSIRIGNRSKEKSRRTHGLF